MKKASTITAQIILFCFIFLAINYSYGQKPIAGSKITINTGGVFNFKELADYRLAHPLPLEKFHIADPEEGRDEDGKFKFDKTDHHVRVFNFPDITEKPEIISPSAITVFNGVIDNHTEIPPDVGGTVGDSLILATTNQEFGLYTKTGVKIAKLPVGTFFSAAGLPAGGGFSDPHAVYDAIYHKYIVVIIYYIPNANGDNTYVAVCVSKTPDPSGDWFSYNFKPYTNITTLFDYPQVGFNNKWVVITGNSFLNGSSGSSAQTVVLNRADLYSGTAGTASTFSGSGRSIFSVSPAVTTDTSVDTEYMVSDYSGTVGYIKLYTITGAVNSPVYTEANIIAVNQHWSESGVSAKQPGTTRTVVTGDTRIINAVYTNGSLWFSHTVFLPSASPIVSGADWWQVDPAKDSVIQFGRIYDPTGNTFYYYPSIAVDPSGNVLLGYTISSPTMYASGGYSFHAASDPLNTMEDNYTYKNGTAIYNSNGGYARWGDFSISSLDPANGNFWTIEDYATSPANTWATSIAEIATTACSGMPVAGSVNTPDSACNGSAAVLGLNGSSAVTGLGYQWQQSANGTTGWTDATGTGAATSLFTTAPLVTATYFRCIVNCTLSGLSDTTSPKLINISTIVVKVTGSANTICKGMSDTLRATGANSYIWTPGNTTGSSLIVKPTLTSTYTANGTSTLGCKASAPFTVFLSKVSVASSKDTLCAPGDSATLTASGALTYVWHPGNETGSTLVVKPAVTTIYTAVGTDSIGCVDSSSITEHVGNCATGVATIGKTTGIQIFPAPAKNFFTLEITGLAGKSCNLSIINILGKKVMTSSLKVSSDEFLQLIDISKFTSGIYFVQVSVDGKEWNARIVKE